MHLALAGLLFRVKVQRGSVGESAAACKIAKVGQFFHINEAEK
jgi:hypothetical protein